VPTHDPTEPRSYPSAMVLARAIVAAARGVTEAEIRAIEAAQRVAGRIEEVPRGE